MTPTIHAAVAAMVGRDHGPGHQAVLAAQLANAISNLKNGLIDPHQALAGLTRRTPMT